MNNLIDLESITRATQIIYKSPYFHRTPLSLDCQTLSPRLKETGARIHFKLESTQVMGSFKIRGIINLIESLGTQVKKKKFSSF